MLVVTARYEAEIGEGPLNKGRDIYESRRPKVILSCSTLTNGAEEEGRRRTRREEEEEDGG